jgi:predicted O-methyltransferase YrrM|tara:strand:+ start:1318 stop:2211 length:894 start_codon:yes stop_codon:yes gene_type:complete
MKNNYKDPIDLFDASGNTAGGGLDKEIFQENWKNDNITDKARIYSSVKSQYYNNKNMMRMQNGEFTIPINRLFSFPYEAKMANLLDGDVAEFGVANGATTIFLSLLCPEKTIYAFDTFDGFSSLGDEFFKTANDNSWSDDIPYWRDWGHDFDWERTMGRLENIYNVVIKKGIFPDTTKGMEDKKFSLVHIDVDIYESTKVGLEYFWNRMVDGGMILVDDFDITGTSFPGVYNAVKDFFKEVEPDLPIDSIISQNTDMQGLIIKPFGNVCFIENGQYVMNNIFTKEYLIEKAFKKGKL